MNIQQLFCSSDSNHTVAFSLCQMLLGGLKPSLLFWLFLEAGLFPFGFLHGSKSALSLPCGS